MSDLNGNFVIGGVNFSCFTRRVTTVRITLLNIYANTTTLATIQIDVTSNMFYLCYCFYHSLNQKTKCSDGFEELVVIFGQYLLQFTSGIVVNQRHQQHRVDLGARMRVPQMIYQANDCQADREKRRQEVIAKLTVRVIYLCV